VTIAGIHGTAGGSGVRHTEEREMLGRWGEGHSFSGPTLEPKLIMHGAEPVCALRMCGVVTAVPLKHY